MTIKQTLHRAREVMAASDVEDSPLESELLLRHALGIDRTGLYQQFNGELSPEEEKDFWNLIERRLRGEPAAYITGHREFYGLDFHVDPGVLIPRPETELLVEKALELGREREVSTVADIGTGSGAIAISLAVGLPRARIYATDISPAALGVACYNCQHHGVAERVWLLQGDLLDPLPEPVDLIVANLPYVRAPDLAEVNTLNFEPTLALDGGSDGLDKIRRLCMQAGGKLTPRGALLLEIGCGQEGVVSDLLHALCPAAEIEVTPDLAGIDRVVSLRLGPDRKGGS